MSALPYPYPAPSYLTPYSTYSSNSIAIASNLATYSLPYIYITATSTIRHAFSSAPYLLVAYPNNNSIYTIAI
jgi:hypothetical protein